LSRGVHLLRGRKGASVDRQVIWRQIVLFNISQLVRVTIGVCRLGCLSVVLVIIFTVATFSFELRVRFVVIVILPVLGIRLTVLLGRLVGSITISISDLLFSNLVNILMQILRAIERHILLEVCRVSIAIALLAIDGHARYRLLTVIHLLWRVHVLLRIELLRLLHHILLVGLHLRVHYLLALILRQ
jgi:hypothetical protein